MLLFELLEDACYRVVYISLVNISSGICLQILAHKVKFSIHTDIMV